MGRRGAHLLGALVRRAYPRPCRALAAIPRGGRRRLVIRSGGDVWSRLEHVQRLREHLVHAPSVRVVTIPKATHFVDLERPERGRCRFLAQVLASLVDR